jgi:hypothetical protein
MEEKKGKMSQQKEGRRMMKGNLTLKGNAKCRKSKRERKESILLYCKGGKIAFSERVVV